MSLVGKQPIEIPSSVTVDIAGNTIKVSGPQGELELTLPFKIKVEVKDNQVLVTRLNEDKKTKSCHGTVRAHLNNMVKGVVTPWTKELEIRGTGYKLSTNGDKLIVSAGYIHPVEITAPQGVKFQVTDETKVVVSGADIVKVGQVASNIRKIRKPEPYKGKGVRYVNEFIKLKPGKAAKATS